MKSFTNLNARDLKDAANQLRQASQTGQKAAIAGGGSDLLGMVKERLITPDVVVSLKSIRGNDRVTQRGSEVVTGGRITLDALSRDPLIRKSYTVLAEAAGQVRTPQIRNAGTPAGNVCQRPWCWYYRNAFP